MKKKELRKEREERRRQEYRRLILQATERVILHKGLSGLTMDDVAREAEFSKPTLYHYFRSKGELVLEILANFFDEFDQAIHTITAHRQSASQKLKQGIHFFLQFNQQKENISRMLMMDRAFQEKVSIFVTAEPKVASETDRKFIAAMKAKRRDILDSVALILKEGVASGEFRRIDIPSAVTFFESSLMGYCHLRIWHEHPYSVKAATEIIHGYFLQGIDRKNEPVKGESR
jgi:AcrR family transcriptional regulator